MSLFFFRYSVLRSMFGLVNLACLICYSSLILPLIRRSTSDTTEHTAIQLYQKTIDLFHHLFNTFQMSTDKTDEILQQLDDPIVLRDENSPEFLSKKKKALWRLIAVSSGIDLAMTIPEALTAFSTLGGSFIIEELVEFLISESINKYNIDTDIRVTDRVFGFIPVPGVTALTIRCFKELRKIRKLEKK